MVSDPELHRAYDKLANGPVQVGELPDSTRVRGRVAWYVYAGSYREIGTRGWQAIGDKVHASKLRPRGPPGDLYVCDPDDHEGPRESAMITILWAPLG